MIDNDRLAYEKTKVLRNKKDVMAGCDDSDQEDWVEEVFANDNKAHDLGNTTNPLQPGNDGRGGFLNEEQKQAMAALKKKKRFYYYALVFNVKFDHDDDIVYFAFSQPYPYSQIVSEIIQTEECLARRCEAQSPTKPRRLSALATEAERNEQGILIPNANPQSDEIEAATTQRNPNRANNDSLLNKVSWVTLTEVGTVEAGGKTT